MKSNTVSLSTFRGETFIEINNPNERKYKKPLAVALLTNKEKIRLAKALLESAKV